MNRDLLNESLIGESTVDCLIVGGGVVGLSLAYELSRQGTSVRVVDRGPIGREASWAGAGILPPAGDAVAEHPYDLLCARSFRLHAEWAERLRAETDIDTGYRRCGGLYVATTAAESAALLGAANVWREEGVQVESLDADAAGSIEPGLADAVRMGRVVSAALLPGESQLRNPWHLKALEVACRRRGVAIHEHVEIDDLRVADRRWIEACAGERSWRAEQCVIAAGAWSLKLLERLGVRTGILPVRGQMVLYRCDRPPLVHIVNRGPRYLVPREDGRLLVGSTEEEVGFDKRTTDEGVSGLRRLAEELVPSLADAPIEATWAGLRPGSFDGLPYIGRVPGIENLFVAAGHFRSGLFLSPGTAEIMGRLLRGEDPGLDLASFRLGRG